MKRLSFILFFMFFSYLCFSQNTNLIYKEYFDYENIENLIISSFDSDINTTKYSGDSILIEVYSNNINYLPSINIKDKTLSISGVQKSIPENNYLTINLYFPVNFIPQELNFSTTYGNLNIDYLPDSQNIDISTQCGNINLSNSKTSSIIISSIDGNLNLSNIHADYFIFETTGKGNINFVLNWLPEATSKISTKVGNINLNVSLTKNQDYQNNPDLLKNTLDEILIVYSQKGKAIINY